MNKKEIQAEVERILTTDGREPKYLKRNLRNLVMSRQIKDANQIMEKIGDFGMMSDAGNKKIARAVSQAKNEKDLKVQIRENLYNGSNKYSEDLKKMKFTKEDPDAMQSKAKGVQNRPDANVLVQLRKFKDITKDGEVRTDDMKKVKVKRSDAVKVHDTLMKVKAPIRDKYLQLLQKDKNSFNKVFNAVLKIANQN